MDSQDHKMKATSSGKTALDDKMIETLTSKIDYKLNALSTDTPFTSCIHRVPDKPRKANEAAYTPRLVSIGPLHRERGQLQGMESYKLRYLRNFLTRFKVNLCDLVMHVARDERYIREYYEDTINLNKEQFTEVLLLDGIFVIELFLKNYFLKLREGREVLFENHWMQSDLLHDMLLLENQLPIRAIASLLLFVDSSLLKGITLYDLAHEFFRNVGNTEKLQLTEDCRRARHFVEFLLSLHGPMHRNELPSFRARKFENTRSATELQQAGVKFRRAEKSCLFNVDFTKGELTLPSLMVNDSTETFFRNLIAFEQCGYYSKHITSYVIFMDNLINTPNDVDLLVKHEIIKNELGESKAVADLFNNLYKEVVTETDEFYFDELCDNLNAYSSDPFHAFKAKWFRWKMIAKRDYFSTPWSFISLLAAGALLILTVIQTVCSLIQAKSSSKG
ncbi:hypothetical protein CDL12_04613 [Handroanthus impetiginosus]|uniref:Uncharacterized protein n=1 Tax=Handroanthus impetiginosus TaxID=429701 RepID=A0A2G9HYU0_9LAMI|nr:hypothetical protein CDL12_04613 [Handroanthus impetiginosus]